MMRLLRCPSAYEIRVKTLLTTLAMLMTTLSFASENPVEVGLSRENEQAIPVAVVTTNDGKQFVQAVDLPDEREMQTYGGPYSLLSLGIELDPRTIASIRLGFIIGHSNESMGWTTLKKRADISGVAIEFEAGLRDNGRISVGYIHLIDDTSKAKLPIALLGYDLKAVRFFSYDTVQAAADHRLGDGYGAVGDLFFRMNVTGGAIWNVRVGLIRDLIDDAEGHGQWFLDASAGITIPLNFSMSWH